MDGVIDQREDAAFFCRFLKSWKPPFKEAIPDVIRLLTFRDIYVGLSTTLQVTLLNQFCARNNLPVAERI
jgi:hypothetical protein